MSGGCATKAGSRPRRSEPIAISEAFLRAKLDALRKKHPHAGDFCFFTDTENLAIIFASGRLLCRSAVLQQQLLRRDCASPSILQATPPWVHDYVRLYFAPATPMLYQIEGIKRVQDKWPECPRPAYIVFDPAILTLAGVRISTANMAAKRTVWQEASDGFFDGLPFEDIYYRGAIIKDPNAGSAFGFDPDAARGFSRRQAEVLVHRELSLSYARALVFRSEAERDLAARDVGGLPAHLSVEVKPDWFFAQQRGRPHLKSFSAEPGGTFEVANARRGDSVVQVGHSSAGVIRAWSTTLDGTTWREWTPVDHASLGLPTPPRGRRTFFLLGHRVAEEDC